MVRAPLNGGKAVTIEMKTWVGRQISGWPIFDRCLRLFFTLLLSTILLPLKSRGEVPQNLVDLYNWTNETMVGAGDNPNNYVFIRSATSADFDGGFTYESGGFVPVQPTIAGTMDTIPGVTYEICFTVQDDSVYGPNSAQIYFGNTCTDIDLPPGMPGPNLSPIPVNIDFTVEATSATTTMSFEFGLDPSDDEDSLYNLSVTEVPEARSENLMILFGCTLLCMRKWPPAVAWLRRGKRG